jgi:hypothetical protein
MAKNTPKKRHMGYRLRISRDEGKAGTWEAIGFLFGSRYEAESYHWRYYRGLPHRVVGVRLDVVPVQLRSAGDDSLGRRSGRPAA